MKRSYSDVTEQIIDHQTGESIRISHTETSFRYSEPPFVKLYLQDIARLNSLPTSGSGVMNELVKRIGYDNRIVLNATVKREIANTLGFKTYRQVDNAIQELKKKGIFTSAGTGVLMANPDLFGKGSWEQIKELRTTIVYSEQGRFITTAIAKDKRQETLEKAEKKILEEAHNILNSSVLPINPLKLVEFLSDPENQTNTVALGSIISLLSTTAYCIHQLTYQLC